MKKLTQVQQQVLDDIRTKIEVAKQYDNYRDYYNAVEGPNYNCNYRDYDTVLARDGEEIANRYKKYWEMELNNITLTHCSSSTIRALEKLGYIRIIKDGRGGIDTVELLEVK